MSYFDSRAKAILAWAEADLPQVPTALSQVTGQPRTAAEAKQQFFQNASLKELREYFEKGGSAED